MKHLLKLGASVCALSIAIFLQTGCGSGVSQAAVASQTPGAHPTPPVATPTPAGNPSPTPTPAPQPSPTPTATPTPKPSPTPTPTPKPSPTPTPAPTPSPTPTPAPTPAPSPTPTSSGGFYVSSSTGSDSNSGTASSPWKTIAHAASMVKPGSVVHVLPGTYGNVTSTVSGTSTARIRFISDTKWGAHLVGTAGGEAVWLNNGSYVDIMGFDITGNSPNGLENLGSFSRMIGNRVHDIVASCDSNGGSGINNASYTAHDDDIIGNVVFNIKQAATCGALHGVGIYHSNLRGHVLNNFVAQTGRPGIQLWHAANNVVVANNTVVNTRDSGIVIGAGDSPGGVVCNNTTVTNNISINNAINGIQEFGSTGPNNKYLNNLAFGNSSGEMSIQTGSASGTILSNPQFVNYTGDVSGDYHLQSTSPAIDSGTTTGMPSTDLDGGARPAGSGPDIGAYEYNSPAAIWPWM